MSQELLLPIVTIFGTLIVLMLMGTEIGVAMGVAAVVGMLLFTNQPLQQFIWTSFSTMNSFTLTCVPLFVFMGAMFANTGVIRSLFGGLEKMLSGLPGGLANSVIGASALFGAMSGSSVAAAATFGTISFPEMERRGYAPRLSFGAIAMGGSLSVLIPPSVILIIYGVWSGQSVARLFAAALIPGIVFALLLMTTASVQVLLNPRLAPEARSYSWRERLAAIKEIFPWLGIIVLVLGVIFSGIATPTEAAAVGAFLSIAVALGYRQMSFRALRDSALTALRITSMLALIAVAANMLAHVVQFTGISNALASFMLDLPLGKYGILAVICLVYLILGMFFEAISMLLLTTPFVIPIITGLGLSLTWWGVVYVILAEIGMVTPPFGLILFTLHSVAPKHSMMTIFMGALPFMIPALAMIALLVAFPQISLWLPEIMFR